MREGKNLLYDGDIVMPDELGGFDEERGYLNLVERGKEENTVLKMGLKRFEGWSFCADCEL